MSLVDDLFLGTAEYHSQFRKICQPAIDFFSLTGVSFIYIKNKKNIINIHTNVAWMEHCMKKHYYRDDPRMVSPDNIAGGFCFPQTYQDPNFKNGMLKTAEDKFNLCHSFSYIEKYKDAYQEFGFATSQNNIDFINSVASNFRLMKRFIRHIQDQLNEKKSFLEKYILDFSALKGKRFYTQKGIISDNPTATEKKIAALKNFGITQAITSVSLTNQERKCLRLYLEGYDLKSIAQKINIAYTTVVSYFENIKNKLGCSQKNELLKIAEVLEALKKL